MLSPRDKVIKLNVLFYNFSNDKTKTNLNLLKDYIEKNEFTFNRDLQLNLFYILNKSSGKVLDDFITNDKTSTKNLTCVYVGEPLGVRTIKVRFKKLAEEFDLEYQKKLNFYKENPTMFNLLKLRSLD